MTNNLDITLSTVENVLELGVDILSTDLNVDVTIVEGLIGPQGPKGDKGDGFIQSTEQTIDPSTGELTTADVHLATNSTFSLDSDDSSNSSLSLSSVYDGEWNNIVDTYATTIELNSKISTVIAGTDITIDNTDPNNPIINSTAASTGASNWETEDATHIRPKNSKRINASIIDGLISSSGHTIQDNGVSKTQRTKLNFLDAVIVDDLANDATKISGLKGDKGDAGAAGTNGLNGIDGLSAFDSAVLGGYTGSEAQFNSDLSDVSNKADSTLEVTVDPSTGLETVADVHLAVNSTFALVSENSDTADLVLSAVYDKNWNDITNTYATKTELTTGYVPLSRTVAGKALTSDITVALNDLSDVVCVAPSSDDTLFFDGTNWTCRAAVIGSGNGITEYLTDNDSPDVTDAKYVVLSRVPSTVVETSFSASVSSANSPQEIKSFIMTSAGIGTTTIPAGVWNFNIWAKNSGGTTSGFEILVYVATVAGGVVTLGSPIFTTPNQPLTSVLTGYEFDIVQATAITGLTTAHRLVFLFRATQTINTSRTVTIYVGGSTHASHVHTPLQTRHNDLAGLNAGDYIHMTSALKTSYDNTVTAVEALNNITEIAASGIAATYALELNKQVSITGTLPNGVNSTLTLPTPISAKENESVVHFASNATAAPTLAYSGFVPVWGGGKALAMVASKRYTIVFEQIYNGTAWVVLSNWREY